MPNRIKQTIKTPKLLTTAEILYHFPDYPTLLQSYIWQDVDKLPHLPKLQSFLQFWHESLEGKLHSVAIAQAQHIPQETLRHIDNLDFL